MGKTIKRKRKKKKKFTKKDSACSDNRGQNS